MPKTYKKKKEKSKENPNPAGPKFRTPSNIKNSKFSKHNQTFNNRIPVNVVRHKG